MEALHSHSCLPTGEQSGVHDQPQPGESALPLPDPQPPKSPSSQNHEPQTQQTRSKQGGPQQQQQQQQHHGQHHKLPNKRERKRLRHQRQSVDSDTPPAEDGKHAKAEATPTRVARTSSGGTRVTPSSSSTSTQSTEAPDTEENQEGTLKQKRERKPGKPGKYVCSYCGRACAKPSVLQKHIRSHTGERPYPCAPCGFSFKTKSNLYKHRKSHTHRVKAGLASGEPSALQEPVPESEDETRQPLSAASSNMERQGSVANEKTHEDTERSTEQSSGMDNSYAVKKRLAMRLSRGKRGPLGSSDSISSSMGMGSRGSTESGYFSRSESTEQSQDSPPNVTKSAKSYAEIILGKYGRLGHLQRMSRHQDQQPSGSQGQQEKSIPFTVPKKQVIDHITNLITINEAVVDTSKIDSVKPRRFSLSRRSSTESKFSLSLKESPVVHHSTNNPGDPGFKSSGSITMGVPCEKFHHHQSLHVDSTAGQTSTSMAPLLRSLSMPSAASSTDASSGICPRNFRLSQSFDERSETQSRRIGMLRRQPAIELPPGAEFNKEEHSLHSSSDTLYNHNMSVVPPDHKQCQPEPYECETCGVGCKNWEGYKAHKRSLCIARLPQESLGTTICQLDRSQLIHYPINRPGVLAMRKRRKEESFESDEPSSPVSLSIPTLSTLVQGRDERSVACSRNSWSRLEQDWGETSKGFSVIQHTSSFEKQDTLFTESQGKEEEHIKFPSHEDASQKQLQEHSSKPTPRKLVRQRNVQVPEIFITEDSNTNVIESIQAQSEMASLMPKQTKRTEEFQWPQRSLTLSGVPIEKLPPKKKRIRLAEAAQSSGESMSSFDSISLPRSPSQDSCASHASSRSASFEESTRPGDMETLAGIPLRRSRAPNMLTVPGLHHHKREMRRSASEQAPHDPQQQSVLMAMSEMRSKSFDYSSLSPERSAAGWRDRRKCLLMRHTPVRDPEEEEQPAKPAELKLNPSSCIIAKHTALKVNNPSHCSPSPDPVSPSTLSRQSPGPQHLSSAAGSPLSGEPTSCNPVQTLCGEPPSQWKLGQSIQLTGHCFEVLPSQNSVESPDPLQRVAPSPLCSGKPVIISLRPVHTYIHPAQPRPVYPPHPLPTQCPLGIARAHYLPISTGLKLEIPVPTHSHDGHSEFVTHPLQILHPHPNITLSPELLRPSISPAVAVVRLQADTNTLASAIYTTLSQTTTSRSQEPVCSALNSGNRNTSTSEHNSHLVMTLPVSSKRLSETLLPVSQLTLPPGNHLALPLAPGSQLWSEEGCRSSGSGSYKRMLSPSNSVDFSPESKQQQKRVKEEEEESCVGNVIAETSTKEEKVEIPTCLPRVCTPISPEGPSYPTLQSTTSHSWCYLNYVKPNPSTSTDQPSVYSSWSTSEYDPNPPGLSTKTALSLLDCKQRVSYTIYTMSPMSSTPAETTPEPADMKTPCPSEVHATLPGDSHRVETTEEEQSAEDKEPKKEREEEEEKEEKEKEEEAQSTSKCREVPPRIWICEGGSSEEYVYVRGRGRGRYVCEECGIRCKKPSMLRKHIRLHTDSRPYVCKHCNFAFKTKGNLTKHMKSKAHGKKCHDGPMTGSSLEEAEEGGSEDCSVWPETGQDEHRYSDVSETEEDDDDNEYDDEDDDGEEESWSHEDPSSTSHLKPPKPPNQNRTTTEQDRTRTSGPSQPSQPQRLNPQEPSLCYPAGSPSKKRALFSRRRHLDCAGHRSPRHCPSPALSPSPSHHLSSSSSHRLSSSPSHCLPSSPAPALSPSPSHHLSSSPSHHLSSSPSHRLSSSPSHRLSSSPSHHLSSSPSHRLSSSPSQQLSSSPSQHLSSSPSHRLSSSPSHRLSSSPSHHLSSSPSHRLSSSPSHRLSSSPSHHLSSSPSHRLSSSPSHRLSSSPSHHLSSSPSQHLSSSPSHRLSSSPSHRLSSSPSHHLSSSPSHRLSSSPSHRLSSSPSHHLSSSPSHHLSSSPSHRLSSSPSHHLSSSPSQHLSPAHSLSPRVDLSPLRCPSPRDDLSPVSCHPSHPTLSSLPPSHKLSPAPCHPSPPSSLSLLGCHVSPSLERHPSPLRGLSPVRPKSPSGGSPAPQATIPAQHRIRLPRDPSSNPHRDRPATATSSKARLMKSYSVQEDDELRPPLLSPRTRLSRGGQWGVLSHLPLHSQQLARTANLLIPIGGIHMVQPRTSPLYSLVTSPVAAKDTPTPARMDQSMTAQNTPTPSEMDRSRIRRAGLDEVPLSWPSSLKDNQNSLKEADRPSTSMHTSYQDNRVGEGEAGAECRQSTPLPDKAGMAHVHVCTMRPENHGSLSQREETKLLFTGTEVAGSSHTTGTRTSTLSKGTTHTERDTDTHFREGSVFPVTTQGQKTPPSFQTKL
ncbi:transcription factor HIVEP3-like isoform X2 [Salvelinus fontinalis]|uniref:transcription factor HIVEP3-like isoform X2 n=1 Tax=Salvelinus fontinalis TaxID=8038 RepID=UPI00248589E9|nr:transcription factor HIVEP3-like isoform X2 [Salvelinus fontinalis]